MRTKFQLTVPIVTALLAPSAWCIPCWTAPVQTRTNVDSNIRAAIGRLGVLKAGDVEVGAKTEVKNLLADYPNSDRLYAIQLFGSSLCAMLNESKSLTDQQRLDAWNSYRTDSFRLLNNLPPEQRATQRDPSKAVAEPPPRVVRNSGETRQNPPLPVPPTSRSSSTVGDPLPATAFANSRAEWSQKYYSGFEDGSFNVIVASFEGDAGAAERRVNQLGNVYPNVDFYVAHTLARDGRSNPRFAVFIANVKDFGLANRLAAWARKVGIAPDAYVVRQHFD